MVIGVGDAGKLSFSTHVAQCSHGHVSYFYHHENIGACLGFEQPEFLFPLLHQSEGARAKKKPNIPTTLQETPFSKLAMPALCFSAGTFALTFSTYVDFDRE
jgi:hypothetical protein